MSNNDTSLEQLLKSKKISQLTFDKVTIAKKYIERKYNLKTIKNIEWNTIMDKINKLNISEEEKEKVKKDIYEKEVQKYRKQREKQSIRDYESISIIGRGAFGEVHVCREKKTGEIVAIKKIRKDVLVLKNQIIHVRNEQQFLSKVKNEWTVELKASFQEDDFLYLVMEFLPGGDLMNLLIKKDIFTEEEARFYTAELILAIESIHKLDCIHRDIKPDNILIDKSGHVKLSDFGLAKVSEKIFEKGGKDVSTSEKQTHKKNYSCVGTAYYVAPEVLNKQGYGQDIDWWSVGVIFFEMLVGYAPFFSRDTADVCYKILNWQKYLKIPSRIKVSKEAEDLIKKMINNSNIRLGKNGADEIKAHPFFAGVDWENIRKTKPPFIPELKNDYDVSYFETFEVKEPFYPPLLKHKKRKDIEYIGYTYKGDDENGDTEANEYASAIEIIDSITANIPGAKEESESSKICQTEPKEGSNTQKIPINKMEKIINTSPMIFPAQKKIQIIQLPLKKAKVEGGNHLSDRSNSNPKNTSSITSSQALKSKILRKSPSPKRPININKNNSPGKGIKMSLGASVSGKDLKK